MASIAQLNPTVSQATQFETKKPPKTVEFFCKKYFENIFTNPEKLLGKSFEQLATDGLKYKTDLENLCEELKSVKELEATIKNLQVSDPHSSDLQAALQKKSELEKKLIETINTYVCQIDTDRVGNQALSPFSQSKVTFDHFPEELWVMIFSWLEYPWMLLLVSKRVHKIAQDPNTLTAFLQALSQRGEFCGDFVVKSFQQMTLPPDNKGGLLGYIRKMQLGFPPKDKQLGLWELQIEIEKRLKEADQGPNLAAFSESFKNQEPYTTFTILGSFEQKSPEHLSKSLITITKLLEKTSTDQEMMKMMLQGVLHKSLELARTLPDSIPTLPNSIPTLPNSIPTLLNPSPTLPDSVPTALNFARTVHPPSLQPLIHSKSFIFLELVHIFLKVMDIEGAIKITKEIPSCNNKDSALSNIIYALLKRDGRDDINRATELTNEITNLFQKDLVLIPIVEAFLKKPNIEGAMRAVDKILDPSHQSNAFLKIQKASPQKEDPSNG